VHKAIVAMIDKTISIPGADRIHTAYVLGEQVIVSKDWIAGMIGVLFPAELQLSEEFCHYNNLYRHSEKNVDPTQSGFFDDKRRVRCQPFLKVKSEAFFVGLESLDYLTRTTDGSDLPKFKVGDTFDELLDERICQKYVSPQTQKAMNAKGQKKNKTSMEAPPMFHKHVNTEQLKHYLGAIPEGALLSFHAKVHGTSARYAHCKVIRRPTTFWQKIKNKLGLFKAESWEYLAGTRNVILYPDQVPKAGFHGKEQFRFDILTELRFHLEKGMTIYGEIAGYVNGSPIMARHSTKSLKDKAFKKKYGETITYDYGCKETEWRFHIYRISYVTEKGSELDFTSKQIEGWCEKHSFLPHHEIHKPMIYDGDMVSLSNLVESLTERPEVLTEDYIDPSHISEGIVLRVDHAGQRPRFYKNKSYAFKVMEGIAKEEEVDLEDVS